MPITTTDDLKINFSVPSFVGVHSDKYQLLTLGGVLVTGPWRGYLGEYYLGWAPLPKADKSCKAFLQGISAEARKQVGEITPTLKGVTVTYLDGRTTVFE